MYSIYMYIFYVYIIYIYHPHFIRLSAHVHLGCFQYLDYSEQCGSERGCADIFMR
jgi:hypothetical protein